MPPRKERTPELRQRLLDVAIELLATDGASAVTTRRVASIADTSAPAIYELFGGKGGLIRAVFFEGFRRLGGRFAELPPPQGTAADIVAAVEAFRSFTREHPRLFEVMYGRSFESFRPGPDEQALGDETRSFLVGRAEGCVGSGALHGDPLDIAHACLALAIGLATQETAGWLGSTAPARDRRWRQAISALLAGYAQPMS